ncbi:Site-specific recombinase XerD [Spirosomataceae bacterium TFI 002]|nr:Site-specific recombinase XerD [Spirosomataceae bacterium TFI 002]
MASTKVKLRPDKKGRANELAIYVQVCINGKVKLYPTGQKSKVELWDAKTQKIKKSPGDNNHVKLNMIIDKKHQQIKDIIIDETLKGNELSFDTLSKLLQADKVEELGFDYWFAKFYESQNLEFRNSTLKHYKVMKNQILNFCKRKDFQLSEIDYDFYNRFKNWLITEKLQSNSTVNKRLKTLKTFLKFCGNHGAFDVSKLASFQMLTEKPATKIALTEDELMSIYKYDFGGNARLNRVRDLFSFCCFTGLRESDVQNLKPANIQGDFLKLNIIKTSMDNGIPLNQHAKAILNKYENSLPRLSQQRLNMGIKEIGKIVGLDQEQVVVRFQGGKRIEEVVPRYELLSSHVGRRTFITISIAKGIPIPLIQSITGHKDLKSFQKYIKMNDQAKLDAMKLW